VDNSDDVDNDQNGPEIMWPVYADLQYEYVVDNCGSDFDSFVIEAPVPDQCDELIRNGDFESDSTEHWRYVGNYGLELVDNSGGGFSMKAPNAEGGPWVGPGQYLDTRCLEQGYVYYITAEVKLTESVTGAWVGCNPDYSNSNNDDDNNDTPCPEARLRFTNRVLSESQQEHDWETFGTLDTSDQEWNTLSGSYVATEFAGSANAAFLYITGVRKGIDIQIDNVRLTRSSATRDPTLAPSAHPSVAPSEAPTPTVTSAGPNSLEGSNVRSIRFAEHGVVQFESSSQETATVLSTKAHKGVVDAEGNLELVVHVSDRDITDSGWQPSMVLFFAPEETPIDDVTTRDNEFHNFQDAIVAYANHRMYPGLGSYFRSYTKQEDGTLVSTHGYAETIPLPTTNTALKLTRRAGYIRSFYSLDAGTTWIPIGDEELLPPDVRYSPLKIGYRLFLEYKTSYRLDTRFSIVSGGEVPVPTATPSATPTNPNSNSTEDPTVGPVATAAPSVSEDSNPPTDEPTWSPSTPTPTVNPTTNPSSLPSANPTLVPTICADDGTFRHRKKEKRSCSWVAKQMRKGKTTICDQDNVRDACRVTCGECRHPCIDDPSFHHGGNEKKTCEWVFKKKKKDRKKLCKKGNINAACRLTCGVCSHDE